MITLPRSLVRQFHSLLKRVGLATGPPSRRPIHILITCSASGFVLQAASAECALEYRHPSAESNLLEQFAISVEAMAACEGKTDDPVMFERHPDSRIALRWDDSGVPQMILVEDLQERIVDAFPAAPETMGSQDRTLLQALEWAMETTEENSSRYALDMVLLRGRDGTIQATDSRQALVQTGFAFPWTEDILLPASRLLSFREFRAGDGVSIGATGNHVALRIGPWTCTWTLRSDRRFPDVERVCPSPESATTRITLEAMDLAFLERALPRLPARQKSHSAVTMDVGESVTVRAEGDDGTCVTELLLSNSRVEGSPIRISIDRQYLQRAAALGFSELEIVDGVSPITCRDGRRIYFWMAHAAAVVPPTDQAVRIDSAAVISSATARRRAGRNSVGTKLRQTA